MKTTRTMLAMITVLALLAAACGDGSGAADPPPPPVDTTATTTTAPLPDPPAPTTTVPTAPSTTTTTTTVPDEPPPALQIDWQPPVVLGEGPSAIQSDIAAGPAGLVALGFAPSDLDAFTRVLRSDDGRAWVEAAYLEGIRLFTVVAGGPGYVAVGERQVGGSEETGSFEVEPAVFTSPDGATWRAAAIAEAAPASATGGHARPLGLARPGEAFAVLTTADGPDISGGSIRDVAVTASGLLAVGRSPLGHQTTWSSVDGQAWMERAGDPFGGTDAGLRSTAASDATVVALGSLPTPGDYPGPVIVWWSADGQAWEEVATFADDFGAGPLLGGIVPFGGGFVLAGAWPEEGPVAWTSPDGRAWSGPVRLPTRPAASSFVHHLATDGTTLVAVGDDVLFGDGPADYAPSVWTSADGVAWQQEPPAAMLGDLAVHAADPRLAVPVGDRWMVFGEAWSYDDTPSRSVLWEGRTGGPRLVDVELHFLADAARDCDEVAVVTRPVAAPGVLRGALEALLAGPTPDELAAGVVSTFSDATAGMLGSVTISDGVARVDFRDFSQIIPNASTSCGLIALYAQLDGTVTQFPSVDRVIYSFDGDVAAFYEWLQGSPPEGY